MIVCGGIIFRVVDPNHPGDPALDVPGTDIQFRIEYVSQDEPVSWTVDRAAAQHYPRHLDAVNRARAIGPRCHVRTATDEEQYTTNLRAVAASSSGAVKQAVVETLERDHRGTQDAPRPQNSFPASVRDQTALLAAAPDAGISSRSKRLSKRARMAALKRAHERTAPATAATERFWWREGQFA